jgi:hypothetical protein
MSRPRPRAQTIRHRYALKRLSSYMDGQLSQSEQARIQAHLDACPDCRDELRTLRWTKDLAQQMPVMPVPRSFIVREADLETQRTTQPRPFLVPALARLQAAAAIVAILLVLVVAGELFARGGISAGQGARLDPIEAPAPEVATQAVAGAPKRLIASPAEQSELAPETRQSKSMGTPAGTPTPATLSVLSVEEAEPTAAPTLEPTEAGHTSEITSTESNPTPVPTAMAMTAPTQTPVPDKPTQPPASTATALSTPAVTAPPPAPDPQRVTLATDRATGEEAGDEQFGSEQGGARDSGRVEERQVWRFAQIGLGVLLVGLLIAIVWLRRWGRLS